MANAEFNYTDTIEDIKEDIRTMNNSAFQQDELRELIEALIDPDHIGSSKGTIDAGYDNLNAAITALKSAVDGAFDKSEDGDTDITHFSTIEDAITVSSDDTLADVILAINDALGGKSNTDTNSDTAAEIDYDDSDVTFETGQDKAKGALDSIFNALGTNTPSSSFEDIGIISDASNFKSAIAVLAGQMMQLFPTLKNDSVTYQLNRRTIWTSASLETTDGSEPSEKEFYASSFQDKIFFYHNLLSTDKIIVVSGKIKIANNSGRLTVHSDTLGSQLNHYYVTENNFTEFELVCEDDAIASGSGLTDIKLLLGSTTGDLVTLKNVVVEVY